MPGWPERLLGGGLEGSGETSCGVEGWLVKGYELHPLLQPLCSTPSLASSVQEPLHSPTAYLLSVLRPPWGCQHADPLLPTCHHPSQAITVTVQGFPPGSGMNGEQDELPMGVGHRAGPWVGRAPGATSTLPMLSRWGG